MRLVMGPASFLGCGTGSDAVLAVSHSAVSAGSAFAGSSDLMSLDESAKRGSVREKRLEKLAV